MARGVVQPLNAGEPTVVGPYRLLGRLGSGGMGRVYLGRSEGGRTVAVKVVHPHLALDEQFRARFRREVQAARTVGDRWTAPVLEADPEAVVPWVATGYVAGPSLTEAVGGPEGAPLPGHSLRALGAGLARALEQVHARGLVHRDVKPSNVLLALDGPRLIDFGIARAVDGTNSLTSTGASVGSPGYMAPEQVLGREVTGAADVFSLGAVLVYAASGLPPFHGNSSATLLYKVVHEEPDLGPLEGELAHLAARCLDKDATARPAPAELARLLAPQGVYEAVASGWLPTAVVDRISLSAVELLGMDVGQTGPPGPGHPQDAPLGTSPSSTGSEPAAEGFGPPHPSYGSASADVGGDAAVPGGPPTPPGGAPAAGRPVGAVIGSHGPEYTWPSPAGEPTAAHEAPAPRGATTAGHPPAVEEGPTGGAGASQGEGMSGLALNGPGGVSGPGGARGSGVPNGTGTAYDPGMPGGRPGTGNPGKLSVAVDARSHGAPGGGRRLSCTVALAVAGALAAVTFGSTLVLDQMSGGEKDNAGGVDQQPGASQAPPSGPTSSPTRSPGSEPSEDGLPPADAVPAAYQGVWEGSASSREGDIPLGTFRLTVEQGKKGEEFAVMRQTDPIGGVCEVGLTLVRTTGTEIVATGRGRENSRAQCTKNSHTVHLVRTGKDLSYVSENREAGKPKSRMGRVG